MDVSIDVDLSRLDEIRSLQFPIDLNASVAGGDLVMLDEQSRSILQSARIVKVVPLLLGSQFVGVLGLSKSRAGYVMDNEDYALIKTIATQAASSFLNMKLVQSLVRSKETEAFHSFSAFVIHDLKNFVSMLSLVLGNIERKFEDPRFRADALTSISLTVEKMKRLMDQLSVFSGEIFLSPADVDLNVLVHATVSELVKSLKSRVVEAYQELPMVRVDSEKIRKVITNLLINADEAMTGGGEIRVSTSVGNGKVSLTVSDDGCGIG
ncbi:MAG: hypothetical protein GTO08_05575, partial [Deltaproteobacteria bacterium]|nr:hypothetical protein [Deltaproteobacteria bacterium]